PPHPDLPSFPPRRSSDLPERTGLHVVQARDRVPASPGQARIARRGDAERIEVARIVRAVIDDDEVSEPGPPVVHADRDAWQKLVLHARGELPVVHALPEAAGQIGI